MLYLVYGNDRTKGRARFQALRDELCVDRNIEVMQEGTLSSLRIDEMILSRGLFDNTSVFILDSILEKGDEQELVAARAVDLASSSNSFLIFEPTLDKKIAPFIVKEAALAEEYALKKSFARPAFNIFALGDALGARNKKDLWVLYQQALGAGLAPEEINGTLFWQVKNMALMKRAQAGSSSGLNPFVAKKAFVFAKNYTNNEIENLARKLSAIVHEDHRGGESLKIALEKLILSL